MIKISNNSFIRIVLSCVFQIEKTSEFVFLRVLDVTKNKNKLFSVKAT